MGKERSAIQILQVWQLTIDSSKTWVRYEFSSPTVITYAKPLVYLKMLLAALSKIIVGVGYHMGAYLGQSMQDKQQWHRTTKWAASARTVRFVDVDNS
nr:unnamed protein product [Callosobruchus analis]